MKLSPILLTIGIVLVAFGLVNHFVKNFVNATHASVYIAVLGVIIGAVGLAVMMMGNRKAA
ncbi:MAG TPA: hypothetical protein VGR88_00975 [Ktedonobacterales bacterium]|nr:hypothetical protein [Ktedonobacterales bacterium]